MKNLTKTILVFFSLFFYTSSSNAEVTYSCWNCMMLGIDGEGNLEGARVDYNAKGGPDLTVTPYPYGDYLQALQLNMISGTSDDLMAFQVGAMITQYAEYLEDLTPYCEKEWGANWKDKFLAVGIDQVTVDGKLVALPQVMSAAGALWYNQTILDQYNLSVPNNWDEWISVSNTLKDNGVIGFMHGAKDSWVNYDMFIGIANELDPGVIYEAEAGNASWTHDSLVKAMSMWGEMFSNGIMQEGALGNSQYPDTHQGFTSGNAAMMTMGTWNNFSTFTNEGMKGSKASYGFSEDFKYGITGLPDMNGDGKHGRLFASPDVSIGMSASSSNKDEAWKALKVIIEDLQPTYAKDLWVPSMNGVAFDMSDATSDFAKAALEYELGMVENAYGKREFIYAEIKTALGDAMQNVAVGNMTALEAMEMVEEASQSVKR